MKRINLMIFVQILLLTCFLAKNNIFYGSDETRFSAGTLTPIFGASVIGYGDTVLTGITAGAGYYIIDRVQLFATGTFYFGDSSLISVDPGIQWIFWETYHFAPYLKVRGGPIFSLSDNNETAYSAFAGGGFYIFTGESFALKIGFLPGYYFNGVKVFAWILDVGIMF